MLGDDWIAALGLVILAVSSGMLFSMVFMATARHSPVLGLLFAVLAGLLLLTTLARAARW
jgi:hypothetical protein